MSELFTLRPGGTMTISWSGELRMVTCDRIENGGAVIRDLTEEEQDELDRQAYDELDRQAYDELPVDEQSYAEFMRQCGEAP